MYMSIYICISTSNDFDKGIIQYMEQWTACLNEFTEKFKIRQVLVNLVLIQ